MKSRFIIIILFFIVLIAIGLFFWIKLDLPKNVEEHSEIKNEFKISQIYYYSNANAVKNDTTYQNPEWDLNLYQYTDIAIYIERLEDYNFNNYIKNIYIDNIKINPLKKGVQSLLYLNPTKFGDDYFDINTDNTIKDSLEYSMINFENEQNDMNYDMPIFFEDLSTPITFKYLNSDIIKNYKVDNTEDIDFDGSLLKRAKIDLKDIQNTFSINLNLISKNDEIHTASLDLKIPLESNEKTIYDGGIEVIKKNVNLEF